MNIYTVKELSFTNFITFDSNRKKEKRKRKNRMGVGKAGELINP
jgi:hypothetical protein